MNTAMIKVSKETHSKFKQAATDKGMKFDSFMLLILRDHAKIEAMRGWIKDSGSNHWS